MILDGTEGFPPTDKEENAIPNTAVVMGMIWQFQVVILLHTIMDILRARMGGIKILLSQRRPMASAG
jgi:hypothetical protein